jgi:hypothetical protein
MRASDLMPYHRPDMSDHRPLRRYPGFRSRRQHRLAMRFFGRPPATRAGEEILWEIDEHAGSFIEPNAAQAGAGRINPGRHWARCPP